MRELEQCVRNVVVRGEYHPLKPERPADQANTDVLQLKPSAVELLGRYYQRVYEKPEVTWQPPSGWGWIAEL